MSIREWINAIGTLSVAAMLRANRDYVGDGLIIPSDRVRARRLNLKVTPKNTRQQAEFAKKRAKQRQAKKQRRKK